MSKTKTITYDPNWQETYQSQIFTATEAVKKIRPGQRVFIGTGTGEPLELVSALSKRATELPDTEIVHLLTFGDAPYAHRELTQYFRVNSFFIAENVRDIIQEGLGDYTPVFLSDIPRLFDSGQLPLDVALIHVTPPDAHGMCSFGVSVDIIRSAAENASLVIAQVNPNMPRTLGDCFIHVNDIDVLVPSSSPILEVPPAEATETTRQIAEYIAALVEDGSTIEFGIGRIPQAMFGFLKDKKDLGVHTEMVTDGIIDLIECGAITGNRKSIDRGKIVASFCLGTKKIYDYVDNNPLFSFHPTEYVNDPAVIRQENKMVAINTALEIDLTGQVCADSIGSKFFSGVGGQVDFNRGASKSHGGKAIIAHRDAPQSRRRRGDDPRGRALCGDRIRRGLPARQEHPGTRAGAHQHRPPEVPGRPAARRHQRQIPVRRHGRPGRQDSRGAEGVADHLFAQRRHANEFPADSSDRRTADARPVLQIVRGDDLLPVHEPLQARVAAADSGLRVHRPPQRRDHCRHVAGGARRGNHRRG
jgi:acyl-CoA hydrolase